MTRIDSFSLQKLKEGFKMNDHNDKKKKDNETWKLWDAIFTSGLLSFFKDSQEAGNDQKKFNQLLLQVVIGLIFAVILFAIGFSIFLD